MASQSADPAAPQEEVLTVKGTNQQEHRGAYVDQDLTKRNVVETAAASDLPPASGPTTLGGIRPVYASDQNTDIENDAAATANAAVEPPAHAPNSWVRGTVNGRRVSRDPYANGGMLGQTGFNNG